jgi:tetratricopeptide (TPR) repeat protein
MADVAGQGIRNGYPGMSESQSPTAEPSREQLINLERSLQVDPGNLRLFHDCAALALRFEDHDALLRAADARLRLHPTDIPALSAHASACALLFLDLNRIPEAHDWAQKALALDPASVGALTVQGTLASARGELDEAAGCYERVLERAPELGRAWIGLGSVALLRQDLPQALEKMQRGIELMPKHVGSWQLLGWTHLLSGDPANAEKAFEQALELNDKFAETHGSLAAIAALRGDTAEANRLIAHAQQLDPACLSVHFAKAVLLGMNGDNKPAERIVTRTMLH